MPALLIAQVAERISALRPGGIARIAIDGPDAAGKSTFAAAIARTLTREVIQVSIDGFHQPPEIRLRRGHLSAEGYYRDSFDYDAVRSLLLDPLSPGGDRRYRRAVYSYRDSSAVSSSVEVASETAVLLFDGVFLLRPELRDYWDLSIYLHVSPEETLRRALTRDRELFGDAVRERYTERYLPGQELYRREASPSRRAGLVIDNTLPETPKLLATGC